MSENLVSSQPSAPTKIWPMYRAVVGVGIFCALVIVLVFEVTRPMIERNKIELRSQAIFDVLPAAKRTETFMTTETGRLEPATGNEDDGEFVFAGYDDNDQLVGLALEAQSMGYADVIRMIYGYSPNGRSGDRDSRFGKPRDTGLG